MGAGPGFGLVPLLLRLGEDGIPQGLKSPFFARS